MHGAGANFAGRVRTANTVIRLGSFRREPRVSIQLHRLLYASKAHVDPCGKSLRDIVDTATSRNAALGVTGVLCFSGDHFLQLLEGPVSALEELMTSIRGDDRHSILREWPAAPAEDGLWFPQWAMGYAYDEQLEHLVSLLAGAPSSSHNACLWAQPLFARLELYRGHIL
jgi:hypothetical protein